MKKDEISKALKHSDRDVHLSAIQHPKATSKHIFKALTDYDLNVVEMALFNQNITSRHIEKLIQREINFFIFSTIITLNKFNHKHYNILINKKNVLYRTMLITKILKEIPNDR